MRIPAVSVFIVETLVLITKVNSFLPTAATVKQIISYYCNHKKF